MVSKPNHGSLKAQNPTYPLILLSNINNLMPFKLDNSNFVLWRHQLSSILKAQSLHGFIDGSTTTPLPFFPDENGVLTTDPTLAFQTWSIQDQAIQTLINATLSQEALSLHFTLHLAHFRASVVGMDVGKKIKLHFLTKEASRKASLRKRTRNLFKKLSEITILCEIEACGVIYSGNESQPTVWPNNAKVNEVIAQYQKLSEMQKGGSTSDQKCILEKLIDKKEEKLRKQEKRNKEKEIIKAMYECLAGTRGLENLDAQDLSEMWAILEDKAKEIAKKIASLGLIVPFPEVTLPSV